MLLEIFSDIVNWAVLLFILLRALGSGCFNNFDWVMTLIAVSFSYIIKYIISMDKKIG
jgi:hypothetical protein